MRINPNIVPDVLAAIQTTQSQETTALAQLASGRRVNQPSDDPSASSQMVQNQALSGQVDQYTKDASSVLNMMQTIDSSLSSVVTSVNQAVAMGLEGANSTVTTAQRQTIAAQVQGIFASVLQTANLTYSGSYVFGGTNSAVQPYTETLTPPGTVSPPPGYTGYQGNEGINSAEIGSGFNVQLNLPGDQLFSHAGSDLLGSLNQLATALQSGTTADITAAIPQVSAALNYLTQQRAFYGGVMSQINSQETFLSQETVNLKSQANTLVGADATQSATMLSQAQTANTAVLSAAAKIMPGSLLDYLPTTL